MTDTLTYLMRNCYCIVSLAAFIWITKQLFIAIRYAVKFFVAEEKENQDMET